MKAHAKLNALNPLSANFTKWSNTLKQFVGKLPTNCLSVFDHFVGLLKVFIRLNLEECVDNEGTGCSFVLSSRLNECQGTPGHLVVRSDLSPCGWLCGQEAGTLYPEKQPLSLSFISNNTFPGDLIS